MLKIHVKKIKRMHTDNEPVENFIPFIKLSEFPHNIG
jgi:hypothetical protein